MPTKERIKYLKYLTKCVLHPELQGIFKVTLKASDSFENKRKSV